MEAKNKDLWVFIETDQEGRPGTWAWNFSTREGAWLISRAGN